MMDGMFNDSVTRDDGRNGNDSVTGMMDGIFNDSVTRDDGRNVQ